MQAAMIFPFVRLTTINMDLTKPDHLSPISSTNSDTWSTWASWVYDVRRRESSNIASLSRLSWVVTSSLIIRPWWRWIAADQEQGILESELYKIHVLFLFLFLNTKHSVLCDSLCHSTWLKCVISPFVRLISLTRKCNAYATQRPLLMLTSPPLARAKQSLKSLSLSPSAQCEPLWGIVRRLCNVCELGPAQRAVWPAARLRRQPVPLQSHLDSWWPRVCLSPTTPRQLNPCCGRRPGASDRVGPRRTAHAAPCATSDAAHAARQPHGELSSCSSMRALRPRAITRWTGTTFLAVSDSVSTVH